MIFQIQNFFDSKISKIKYIFIIYLYVYLLVFSNLSFNLLTSSSHDNIKESSFPPCLSIFEKIEIESSKVIGWSSLYSSKLSEDKCKVKRAA